MKARQISGVGVTELINKYRDAAKLHGQATERGDYVAANKAAELVSEIYAELRRRGESAQAGLLSLLRDSQPGVRLWSASHALEFAAEAGAATLAQLSAAQGFVGMSAKTTLKEWRSGKLRFP
jgi:hypothetical protein